MESQLPPLATQFAGLRAAVTVPSGAAHSCLPACLQALIAAIFARILGRLDQILLLWQAGLLPAPPIRQIAHLPANPNRTCEPLAPQISSRRPSPRRAARTRIRAMPPRAHAAQPHPNTVPHTASRMPNFSASEAIMPSARPRSARAPPPTSHP